MFVQACRAGVSTCVLIRASPQEESEKCNMIFTQNQIIPRKFVDTLSMQQSLGSEFGAKVVHLAGMKPVFFPPH